MSGGRRVKVTSPQTRIALSRRSRGVRGSLPLPGPADPQRAARVFREQRRAALRTVALLGLVLFGTSGLLAAAPAPADLTVSGLPLSWLVLMSATYPVLLVIAALHVRAAERIDARVPGSPAGERG
ncbi:hypothetical protein MTQ01_10405 [Streptomyces sp. XM4193]|uniref:hypothetical protein n=1 Tax=Streptomyces sp. XM4193 TaxID=2929782 RepID=UPI001FF93E41|nr:hypothetical protein [Streptomyces sp. XM4193]MCK1796410.1 hypothetical protein [Streptomyces sp. XM4193]